MKINFHYVGKKTADEYAAISGAYSLDVTEQSGDIADIVENDILSTNGPVEVTVSANYTQIPNFTLHHKTSVGHFKIEGIPSDDEIATITVSGDNFHSSMDLNLGTCQNENQAGTSITVKNTNDFYITLIPAENVTFVFDIVTKNGNNYQGKLVKKDNTTTVVYTIGEGQFLRKNLGAALSIKMTSSFSYVLSFNANGGQDAPAPLTAIGPGSGSHIFTIPGIGNMVYSGFHFLGWKDGDNTNLYLEGDKLELTKDANSKELMAQWAEIKTYTLNFDANASGVTLGTASLTEKSYTGSVTFTIPANNKNLTAKGLKFLGWATTPNADAPNVGDTFTTSSTPVTLYGVWEQNTSGGGGNFGGFDPTEE